MIVDISTGRIRGPGRPSTPTLRGRRSAGGSPAGRSTGSVRVQTPTTFNNANTHETY